jgi:L-fuconolactonase
MDDRFLQRHSRRQFIKWGSGAIAGSLALTTADRFATANPQPVSTPLNSLSRPMIDAHVHLWNPTRYRMPWLDELPSLNRTFGSDDYLKATAGLQIEGMIYIEVLTEPAYSLLEARDIAALSKQNPLLRGIVAWAPLEYGDRVRYYLEELRKLGPQIKGVRRINEHELDPAFVLQPDFIRGVQLLPEFGFTCDLSCTHVQLGETVELVRRCPQTHFILDHIGKPNVRGEEFESWAKELRDMASLPNVVCKISGVVTEADRATWTIEQIKPYVRHVVESFGENRIVFGSDWPVATLATDYRRWVNTLDEITADLSTDQKRKLWAENAKKFYRL